MTEDPARTDHSQPSVIPAGEPGMVIVGGGECGIYAASALREKGWTGGITVVGREPLHAYERPPLSKAALTSEEFDPVHPFSADLLSLTNIDVRTSVNVIDVDATGQHVILDDGASIPYHKLLLAVGGKPRRLPFPDTAELHYLRTHEDALRIRPALARGKQIGVIGAGFIGLEVAASAVARGCSVTVIEAAPRALARAVPAPVADSVVARQRNAGVRFLWSTTVDDIERSSGLSHARISSGETLQFDTIVVGIGSAPELDLAEHIGLEIDNGIAANDRLETSLPNVYAAGDCVSFPHRLFGGTRLRLEAWRNAHDQAKTVAGNMLGQDQPHLAVPWFWSDQYDYTLQVVGLSALAESLIVRRRADGAEVYFGLNSEKELVCGCGFAPGNQIARDIRVTEMLIERQIRVPAEKLVDPTLALKSFLAS